MKPYENPFDEQIGGMNGVFIIALKWEKGGGGDSNYYNHLKKNE